MTDTVNTAEIRVVADASQVEAGLRPAVDAANRAGQAIRQTGSNASGAARNVEAAQRNIVAAIQRTTMAMEAGGRTTAAYYEAQARARNVDPTSLAPYLNQLRAIETAQTQAAESARAQAQASRELAQAQANKDAFLAGLREQVALFGKSTDEVLRYRAAQAGASQEAAHLILQLQNMRAAQEQVEASARAAALAQREAAQATASRDAFVQQLREQIALYGLSTEETLRYKAAQLGAAQAADPLIARLRDLRLAQEQAAYGARMEAQAQREAAQARATQDSFLKGLQQQAQAIGKTRAELLELQAAQLGVGAQARPFIEQLRAAEQGLNAGGMSARQMSAALRGVPAQMTDIIVSLQGGMNPMTVFLQQGGQLRDMFGSAGGAARALGGAVLGLITPWTLGAAAVGVGVAAFKAGHDESIRYSRALALTNNIAGTTSAQMSDMARNIGEVTGSQREGAKALTTLASTGAITRQNLEWFGTVAVDAQHVLNKSVEDTAKEFAELGRSPLTALQSISEKYHFITAATYAQVKAAQEQGRTIEAANIAQRAYAEGISQQRQNVLDSLTDWERGWLRIKKAVSGSVDSVIDFVGGRQAGPQEQIAGLLKQTEALEARIARLKSAGVKREGDKYDPANDRQVLTAQASLDATVREINAIRDKEKASKDAANAKAAEVRANELQSKWIAEENILLTRQELLKRDLKAAEVEGKQNNLDDEVIQNRLMVIRRKYNDVFVAGIDASLTALRRRGEVEDVLSQRALAQIQARRNAGLISEDEALRDVAAQELEILDRRKKNLQSELGMTSKKIGSRREQLDLEGQIEKISAQRVIREKQLEDCLAAARQKRAEASEGLYAQGIVSAEAELKSLMDLVDAQVLSNAEIGLSKTEVADLAARRMLAAAALKEETAAAQAATPEGERLAAIYRKQAEELRNLATAGKTGAVKQDATETSRKALEELNQFLDPSRAQTFGEALREAFGSSGDALSKLMANLDGYGKRQAEIIKHRETAEKNRGTAGFDEVKYLKTVTELGEREIKNRVQGYGDMASAAKGFFSDNSKGYKLMEGAEKAFRAMELASQMESLYTHLFVTTTKATATATGQAVETGAVVAGEAARNTAKVPGVFMAFMSAMGPWGMAAAGVAIAAVLGGAFKGGGGMSLTESRQKTQGTGTVLGSDAKSESIAKSLDLIENATFQGLAISSDMLVALRNIESNIGNFASLVVRTTGAQGDFGKEFETNGSAYAFGQKLDGLGGDFVHKMSGRILGALFGGKVSMEDSGITIDKIALADVFGGKLSAAQYADLKKDGGLFGRDKYSTKLEGLGEDGNRQFALILQSLYESVFAAGTMLDLNADDFSAKLQSFVVDIGKISFKDMDSDEIQKELEAVFSKVGDDLAKFGAGGLEPFQKVGEGYLETLTRVATGYQTVDVVADSLGITFGAVGFQSIAARQRLIDLAGGLEQFTSSAGEFLSDFYTEKEQADALRARLQPTLDKYSIQTGADDSLVQFRDVIKGLKLETAEGAASFAELMAVMPAFKQLADFDKAKFEERLELQKRLDELTLTTAQLREKEIAGYDASNQALLRQIFAIEDHKAALEAETEAREKAAAAAIQAAKQRGSDLLSGVDSAFTALQSVVNREKALLQDAAAGHKALANALRSTLEGMKVSGLEREDRAGAQAQIRAALAIARASGTLPDVDSLKGALSVVGKDSASLFSTQEEYLRDFYSTQADIADLAGLTDKTLSVEEQSIKRLDDILANAQQQVNVLKGLDTTMLTLVDVMRGFDLAVGEAQKDPVASAGGKLAELYRDLLGRAPDAAGLEFYKARMAEGVTLEEVKKAILASSEREDYLKKLRGVPGYAGGGFFGGGLRIVGENGPELEATGPARIFSAAQTSSMLARLSSPSDSSGVLVAEIRALREEVATLKGAALRTANATEQTAGHTDQLAEQIDNATDGGNAFRSEVINVVRTQEVA